MELLRRLSPFGQSASTNLSIDWTGSQPGTMLNDSVYQLYVPESESDIDMDIIFFHGLDFGHARDAGSRAWISFDGAECWPHKWLPEQFPCTRVLAVTYDAGVWETDTEGREDLDRIAENLVRNLILSEHLGVGQGLYRPLVLVGHSVGGLVIDKLCLQASKQMQLASSATRDPFEHKKLRSFLSNLKGVFYYSTPHGGSSLAESSLRFKKPGPLVEVMLLQNHDAARLQEAYRALRKKYKDAWDVAGVVETHKTILDGFCGLVVDEASAKIGIPFGNLIPIQTDHFNVCRPKGRHANSYKNFTEFVCRIAEKEKESLRKIQLQEYKEDTIGLKSRVEAIQKILQTATSLGLYGMGGVGKSTLARAVLEDSCHRFDFTCFITDVKELVKTEKGGQRLKERLLEGLRYGTGRPLLREDADWDILKGRKVLLVFDDVDSEHELEQIPWKRWFGTESRVIATSRNEQFCRQTFINIYEVQFLGREDSVNLFLRHAFEEPEVPSYVNKVHLEEILDVCGGVPLALKVVARQLYKQTDAEIWAGIIERLKAGEPIDGNRDNRLLDSLRLSYDTLYGQEQKMFLDAAILFMSEEMSQALEAWKGCWGPGAIVGWRNLKFKCLVKEDRYGRVWIHETLRMLGRNIACPKHERIESWLRVGLAHDAKELLTSASQVQESAKAEGLIYKPRKGNHPLKLKADTFTAARFPNLRVLKMVGVEIQGARFRNLQVLKVVGVAIQGDHVDLPSSLVFLSWCDTPHMKIPFHFRHMKHLCVLELKRWRLLKKFSAYCDDLTALTHLELEGCEAMTKLSHNISKLTKLTYLGLEKMGLVKLPEWLGELTSLEILRLGESQVSRLPTAIGRMEKLKVLGLREIHGLTEIPNSICNLCLLTSMDLRGTRLNVLPEAFGNLAGLEDLVLCDTRLRMLPNSFGNLRQLLRLNLSRTPVVELPDSFRQLTLLSRLTMDHCKSFIRFPPRFGDLPELKVIYVHGCNNLIQITDATHDLQKLVELSLEYQDSDWIMNSPSADLSSQGQSSSSSTLGDHGWEAGGDNALLEQGRELIQGTTTRLENGTNVGTLEPLQTAFASSYRPGVHLGHLSQLSGLRLFNCGSASRFPPHLYHALQQMHQLTFLTMDAFDAVKSLPTDFGFRMPKTLVELGLSSWRSLQELPESLGQLTDLHLLDMSGCESLQTLPDFLSQLPNLRYIGLIGCKCLHTWHSSFAMHVREASHGPHGGSPTSLPGLDTHLRVSLSSWQLLVDLLERFGHLSELEVRFYISFNKLEEMREQNVEFQLGTDLWGERIVEIVERMRPFYEVQNVSPAAPLHRNNLKAPLFKLVLCPCDARMFAWMCI